MEKTLIRSKNMVDDSGSRFTLYYWMLSREILDERNNIARAYGVEVEKCQGSLILEAERVENLYQKKQEILDFIGRLADGTVTPVSLLSLVDDFVYEIEEAIS
ncbi:MAG: hypothetical protein GX299_10030 [Epulopiscium sp.]|nr:hypothetical protein [Candidatus Epulonipiscium sp.]